MGVKSTVILTRKEAERRYIEFLIDNQRRIFRALVCVKTDEEIEDDLERMNDAAHGGEGYENYSIRDWL